MDISKHMHKYPEFLNELEWERQVLVANGPTAEVSPVVLFEVWEAAMMRMEKEWQQDLSEEIDQQILANAY